MTQTELDLSGTALRDKGIEQAHQSVEADTPGWTQSAIKYLELYPHKEFMAEELRLWAYANGLPKPPHGRAWGAVMVGAVKRGLVVHGGYRAVKNPKAHGTPANVWRK